MLRVMDLCRETKPVIGSSFPFCNMDKIVFLKFFYLEIFCKGNDSDYDQLVNFVLWL